MQDHRSPMEHSVEWRRLNDYLWVGSSDRGPVGTIEHGRRYYAIDTLGSVIARSRDLPGAQAALAETADEAHPVADHGLGAGPRGRHSARDDAA